MHEYAKGMNNNDDTQTAKPIVELGEARQQQLSCEAPDAQIEQQENIAKFDESAAPKKRRLDDQYKMEELPNEASGATVEVRRGSSGETNALWEPNDDVVLFEDRKSKPKKKKKIGCEEIKKQQEPNPGETGEAPAGDGTDTGDEERNKQGSAPCDGQNMKAGTAKGQTYNMKWMRSHRSQVWTIEEVEGIKKFFESILSRDIACLERNGYAHSTRSTRMGQQDMRLNQMKQAEDRLWELRRALKEADAVNDVQVGAALRSELEQQSALVALHEEVDEIANEILTLRQENNKTKNRRRRMQDREWPGTAADVTHAYARGGSHFPLGTRNPTSAPEPHPDRDMEDSWAPWLDSFPPKRQVQDRTVQSQGELGVKQEEASSGAEHCNVHRDSVNTGLDAFSNVRGVEKRQKASTLRMVKEEIIDGSSDERVKPGNAESVGDHPVKEEEVEDVKATNQGHGEYWRDADTRKTGEDHDEQMLAVVVKREVDENQQQGEGSINQAGISIDQAEISIRKDTGQSRIDGTTSSSQQNETANATVATDCSSKLADQYSVNRLLDTINIVDGMQMDVDGLRKRVRQLREEGRRGGNEIEPPESEIEERFMMDEVMTADDLACLTQEEITRRRSALEGRLGRLLDEKAELKGIIKEMTGK